MAEYSSYGGSCKPCQSGGSRKGSRRKVKGVKGGFSLTNSIKNLYSKTKNFFTRNKNHTTISGVSKKSKKSKK